MAVTKGGCKSCRKAGQVKQSRQSETCPRCNSTLQIKKRSKPDGSEERYVSCLKGHFVRRLDT